MSSYVRQVRHWCPTGSHWYVITVIGASAHGVTRPCLECTIEKAKQEVRADA